MIFRGVFLQLSSSFQFGKTRIQKDRCRQKLMYLCRATRVFVWSGGVDRRKQKHFSERQKKETVWNVKRYLR